jgi:hypothetical protein
MFINNVLGMVPVAALYRKARKDQRECRLLNLRSVLGYAEIFTSSGTLTLDHRISTSGTVAAAATNVSLG